MLHSVFIIIFVFQTLSWCQIRGKIFFWEFYGDPNSQIYSISRGFLRGLQIFRLLLRPGITVFGDVRREFTHCGLKLGLEIIPSHLQPAQQQLQDRGTKI